MTDLLPTRPELPTPSRRAVLGAAWTAPVVVAATAAPTYAASSSATLSFDTFVAYAAAWVGSEPTRFETKIQVQHVWTANAPTLTSLTVSLVVPTSVTSGEPAAPVTGDGWAAGSVSGPKEGAWTHTFTWTGTLEPGRSTRELVFTLPRKPGARKDTTLTAYATGTQAATVTRTTSAQL